MLNVTSEKIKREYLGWEFSKSNQLISLLWKLVYAGVNRFYQNCARGLEGL